MYQHLSETAKKVLKLAEDLAKNDSQEYVGTEHVLLAILEHGVGLGAQLLENCSVTLPQVQEQVDQLVKDSLHETWVLGRLPGTPHFKQVLAFAIEEAEKLKDKKVGTEYLLLGLIREKGSIAQRALFRLGVDLKTVREQLAQLQGRPI